MKFNFEDYKGDYLMHCKTEEEAEWFCKLMNNDGRRWVYGDSYYSNTCWNFFNGDSSEGVVYYFNKGEIDSYKDFKNFNSYKYTVLEASNFISNQDKPLAKSELKAGMLVETNGGDLCLLIPNRDSLMFISEDSTWVTTLSSFPDEESLYNKEYQFGIKKIYGFPHYSNLFDTTTRELLWGRKSALKISYQDIKKLLGMDFEIVD